MLRLYQSNRLERLSQRLTELLSEPLAAPLQPEILVVQHPGMARWLSLEIARQNAICANTRFMQPAALVWEMFRAFLPDTQDTNLFEPALLSWRLYDLLGKLDEEPRFEPLRRYLDASDETRRFQLAYRLAEVYDRYLVYRPDWILKWEAGEEAVAGDQWQAELWRRLTSVAELHWIGRQQQLHAYQGVRPEGLPPRLFLIGVPTLSPAYLAVVQWLSAWIDVHLLLLNPCEAHWAEIVNEAELARRELAADGTELYLDVGNPLLAAMGRQGRDFFHAINEFDPGSEEWFVDPGEANLLNLVQSQILRLEMPQPRSLTPDDQSIRFHVCHSPMREAEALYDQLLNLFETLPGLQASDILVMTPDIDTYAPLIEAVFSQAGDRPSVPYSLSDLGGVGQNRLMSAFLTLLDLPGSRFGVNQLLELLEIPEIAGRFGLDETALGRVMEWVAAANIRWGQDGESKRRLGLPAETHNTWRAGLERLLLGYAMPSGEERLWQDLAPLDAVEGSTAPWFGGVLNFCESLFGLERQLQKPRRICEWSDFLQQLLRRFFIEEQNPEQPLQQIRDVIAELCEQAETAGFAGEIPLAVLRARLADSFARPLHHGFLGGGVNFCALAPMRSLPFRVICLLGMNEGDFPREPPQPGFDLMSRRFRFGDRSRRADDRYLFLEVLISVRQHLYVSYVGRDIRDNKPLPPSVLVDELRDYLTLMIGEEGLAAITLNHPLQPFSPSYFSGDSGLFSYSQALRECTRLAGQGSLEERPLLSGPLRESEEAPSQIELEQLLRFFTNPAGAFAQIRLGLRLDPSSGMLEEREPFELDVLEAEEIETALVHALLAGESGEEFRHRLNAQGRLPHGKPGRLTFAQLHQAADQMVRQVEALNLGRKLPPLPLEIECDGIRLSGQLDGAYPQGLFAFSTGRFHPYRILRLWICHLLLNLLRPAGIEPVSRWLEQQGAGRFAPVKEPMRHLQSLLELYRQGMHEPLHFYPGTSWAYMEKLISGNAQQAILAAQRKWWGNEQFPGDFYKAYNHLLLAAEKMPDERFEATSKRILQPLFEHLESD